MIYQIYKMQFSVLLLSFLSMTYINCYVLLQVRRDKNNSNVDAIVHKVVPTAAVNEINDAMKSHSNKRFGGKEPLEEVLLVIDTGTKQEKPTEYKKSEFSKRIEKAVSDFANSPSFRREMEGGDINPVLIHFRNNKPSLLFEMNAETMMKKIQEFLSSKQVAKYADELARRVATAYRSVVKS